jgi:transposase-like protein
MNGQFDLNEALEQIKAGAKIEGKDGVLAPLIKQLTEAALEAELESHLSTEIRNRKNGKSSKTMKSSVGEFDLNIPRDRNGSFEPQLVKKHQTHMSDHIEQKILSLYAFGNSYSQISEHIEELYGIYFSKATISAVTDKVIPLLKEWQQRPLESIYPFVWLDAIHYKIKENGKYVSKAVYTILGVRLDGRKEILGLYLSENEGANFWLQVLTDLNNRGVEDILIYQAASLKIAELELNRLEEKWGAKYPIVIQSWRNK